MSLTLMLVPTVLPLVAALGSSVSAAAIAAACSVKDKSIEPVQTTCLDRDLLVKTLTEHGLQVEEISENRICVHTEGGEVIYSRSSSEEAFMVEAHDIRHLQETIDALHEFETEYGKNVQAFTYAKIKGALEEHGLTLQNEEVLEDDSIMLTLQV